MQSSKTSKKTRKIGQEPVAAVQESSTPAPEMMNSKSRASKTSETKKKTGDTGRAKHRNATVAEPVVDSPVIDPVGVMTSPTDVQESAPAPVETSFPREVSHEHIAKLAHSYWIARDYAHGFAEEDWHRAERELNNKR